MAAILLTAAHLTFLSLLVIYDRTDSEMRRVANKKNGIRERTLVDL